MIVTFAVIGILFSTLDILVRPLFHSYNGCFIYFTLGGTFRESKQAAELGLLIYCGFYAMILAFLAVQFLYRACVISNPDWGKQFEGWKYSLWLVYTLIGGVIWAYASNITRPDDVTLEYMRDEVLQIYGVEIKSVPHFAVLAYNYEGESKTIRWNSVQCIGTVSVLMTLQYSIILICGVVMYRRTQGKLLSTSSRYEKMQKQFFIALIYQIAAPTIFFQLPGFFVLTSPFYDMKISFRSGIVVCFFSVYPLVDTLIVLKVITEYKHAYKRFVKGIARKCLEFLGDDTPRDQTTASDRLAKV